DVAPAARIGDDADGGDALLPCVDGRETFREVAADIEWRRVDEMAGRVYVTRLALHRDARAALSELARVVELRRDDEPPRLVYVAPLVVFDDEIESARRARWLRRGDERKQRRAADHDGEPRGDGAPP